MNDEAAAAAADGTHLYGENILVQSRQYFCRLRTLTIFATFSGCVIVTTTYSIVLFETLFHLWVAHTHTRSTTHLSLKDIFSMVVFHRKCVQDIFAIVAQADDSFKMMSLTSV